MEDYTQIYEVLKNNPRGLSFYDMRELIPITPSTLGYLTRRKKIISVRVHRKVYKEWFGKDPPTPRTKPIPIFFHPEYGSNANKLLNLEREYTKKIRKVRLRMEPEVEEFKKRLEALEVTSRINFLETYTKEILELELKQFEDYLETLKAYARERYKSLSEKLSKAKREIQQMVS